MMVHTWDNEYKVPNALQYEYNSVTFVSQKRSRKMMDFIGVEKSAYALRNVKSDW